MSRLTPTNVGKRMEKKGFDNIKIHKERPKSWKTKVWKSYLEKLESMGIDTSDIIKERLPSKRHNWEFVSRYSIDEIRKWNETGDLKSQRVKNIFFAKSNKGNERYCKRTKQKETVFVGPSNLFTLLSLCASLYFTFSWT